MRFLLLDESGSIDRYPYYSDDLRADHPNISFPSDVSDLDLAEYRVYPVKMVKVEYDLVTEGVRELAPVLVNGEWQQQWEIIELPQEQVDQNRKAQADYLGFWDALMGSTIYASIREQSFNSLMMNTLGTEFIALMGDAKAGRPNEAAIQQVMGTILQVGTFTEQHLSELQAALEAGKLDAIYTL